MQGQHNEHCLGLGRWALILHGSHRELEPFKAAEAQRFRFPSEAPSPYSQKGRFSQQHIEPVED